MATPPSGRAVTIRFRMPAELADRLAAQAPTGVGVGPYARSIILDHLAAQTAPSATEPERRHP